MTKCTNSPEETQPNPVIEYLQATHTGPLTPDMLYALGLRGDRDDEPTEDDLRVFNTIINSWLQRHPDPVNQRSAANIAIGDLLDTATRESHDARQLARRTLAQMSEGFSFEGWQWDLIAELYVQISALDDLLKELALKTGLPIAEVKQLQDQRGTQVHSLEQTQSNREEDYEWQLADPDESLHPASVVDRKAVSQMLSTAMNSLDKRERRILRMLYKQGLPLRVIGNQLGISESRVSQLHKRSLARLRNRMQAEDVA